MALSYTTLASPTERILEGAIDLFVAGFIKLILGVALSILGLHTIGAVVAIFYLLFRDSLPFLQHQSIGKKILNLKAVTTSGKPLDYLAGIKRNFIFLPLFLDVFDIDFLTIGNGITVLLLFVEIYFLFQKESLRLGDKFAETIVKDLK